MANNIVLAEASRLLDASLGTTTYAAPTSPLKLALDTSTGSNSAAGTEVTGGSYARQTIVFGSAAAGVSNSSNSISFTNLPACTVTGIEIFDSSGTPRRAWVGALTASKTVSAGDSLSFSPSSVSATLQ